MIGLGPSTSIARAVSADGSVIVGDTPDGFPFIWDEQNGVRPLNYFLEDEFEIDLEGWTLTDVEDISDNGMTIVGTGIDPIGFDQGWTVQLDCNGNGQFDIVDVSTGAAEDCNANNIPDECDFADQRFFGDVDGDRHERIRLFDILCLLDGFTGDFSKCSLEAMDIAPCVPDGGVNILDIFAVLDAYIRPPTVCSPDCP